MKNNFLINCPTCNKKILIEKINCGIFRHAIKKSTYKQVGPHAKEKYINSLIKNNNIIGCGQPFKINKKNFQVEKCGWI
mgnify:CR=1 FL=1|tara:strand:+ start:529 stop:765 length:237 start_codon:yes stop_codon:yes gene_type:complete